jgi:peptidoglycan/LPS O-acetylase OafA/YrhL
VSATTAASEPSTRNRFVLIDSMRGLAALSVIVYHVSFKFGSPRATLWRLASQHSSGPPITAVVVFFLISGFVLYRPFVQARFDGRPLPRLLPYSVRRAVRILPAYWVALVVVALIFSMHYVFTARGIITYFGFLQLYGSLSTLNGGISPAWTLCVEVTFYAALPLLAWAVRRVGRGRGVLASELWFCVALATIAIAWQGLVFAVVPASSGRIFGLLTMLPGSLDLFAAGMGLAVLSVAVDRGRLSGRWLELIDRFPWLTWVMALGVGYGLLRLESVYSDSVAAWWLSTHELKLLCAALLLAPLIFGHQRRGWLRRLLAQPVFLWLGAVSYAVYLWHKPLLDKLAPRLVSHGQLVTDIAVMAAAIMVAALSYYVVERPVQRLVGRWLRNARFQDGRESGAGL